MELQNVLVVAICTMSVIIGLIIWLYIWAICDVQNFKRKYKHLDGINIHDKLKEIRASILRMESNK